VRVQEGAGFLLVWEPVPTNYCFIFFSPLEIWGVFFAVPNFIGGFMGLWNEEMKYETNLIAIIA
jgi:hypothetical protein